jgi:hypothetical protein
MNKEYWEKVNNASSGGDCIGCKEISEGIAANFDRHSCEKVKILMERKPDE